MQFRNLIPLKIFPILLVNFIGILGYSIVVPILIFIVTDFGGNGLIYGILGATYPFFQFLGAPILGKLSDRIGRKKVLVISQLGTFLAWMLFILAFVLPQTELWSSNVDSASPYVMTLPLLTIFLARMVDGFTGGNISVANAYLSDISTDEDRNANFGKMGASTSLGFVLGPAFAGILASTMLGELLPLILAALISLFAIFIIQIRLEETVPCVVNVGTIRLRSLRRFFQVEHKNCFKEGEADNAGPKNSFRNILKVPQIPLLYGIYFLTFLAFSLFYAGLPIYANTELGWSAKELGIFLAYSSLIMVIVQGPVLTRLQKFIPNEKLIALGAITLALAFVLLSRDSLSLMYIANTLLSFGNGIMWPSFMALLARTGDAKSQGAIQGYGNSMGSMASMFGLILGGLLFEQISTNVFLLGGLLFIIIFLLMGTFLLKGPKLASLEKSS